MIATTNTTRPHRVQMRRDRPWRADHPDAVIVDRRTRFGNPFAITCRFGYWMAVDDANHEQYPVPENTRAAAHTRAVALFRETVEADTATITVTEIRTALAGRDLACWCPPDADCHADVLLAIANTTDLLSRKAA